MKTPARAGIAVLAVITATTACADDPTTSARSAELDEVPTVAELNNAYIIEAPPASDLGPQRSYLGGGTVNAVAEREHLEGEVLDREDFERFGDFDFSHRTPPFVTGGVSYESSGNILIGTKSDYGVASNVICSNGWTPVVASVPDRAEAVDLLGFDVTVIGRVDLIDLEVRTTGGTHTFADLPMRGAPDALFFGFAAPDGERVTGFRLTSRGSGSGPCVDNVVIGTTGRTIQVTLDAPDAVNPDDHGGSSGAVQAAGSLDAGSEGVYPVAVLSDEEFDATTLDASTATFGPDEATEAHDTGHLEDVDDDGDVDMMLHFEVQETGIGCGDAEATLTAETTDGRTAEGTVSFETTGCRDR